MHCLCDIDTNFMSLFSFSCFSFSNFHVVYIQRFSGLSRVLSFLFNLASAVWFFRWLWQIYGLLYLDYFLSNFIRRIIYSISRHLPLSLLLVVLVYISPSWFTHTYRQRKTYQYSYFTLTTWISLLFIVYLFDFILE